MKVHVLIMFSPKAFIPVAAFKNKTSAEAEGRRREIIGRSAQIDAASTYGTDSPQAEGIFAQSIVVELPVIEF